MSPQALEAHTQELGDELGAVLVLDPEPLPELEPGEMAGAAHIVEVDGTLHGVVVMTDPATSPLAYLLTLHELGHLALMRGPKGWRTRRRMPVLREEACAWRWALTRSLIEPGPEEWAEIAWRLKTYGDYRRFKRDPLFDRLYAEAERKAA